MKPCIKVATIMVAAQMIRKYKINEKFWISKAQAHDMKNEWTIFQTLHINIVAIIHIYLLASAPMMIAINGREKWENLVER